MTSRERFLKACHNKPVDRPPVWVMRQAGRYLPEYRALRDKHSFHEMASTPELACEVTLLPMKRFPLDAAILFSDILVVPEALGQAYEIDEAGGIRMAFKLNSPTRINEMNPEAIREKLVYVEEAMALSRKELGPDKALLGFGGSPWTLAVYMIEGGSSRYHETVKQICYRYPQLFEALMEKLTAGLIDFFRMQIRAGADAIQIFDSFAHLCPVEDYWSLSLQWVHYIALSLGNDVPVIFYSKGMGHHPDELIRSGANVFSVDWTVSLPSLKQHLGEHYAVQGNLDSAVLSTTPQVVRAQTAQMLESMKRYRGYIANLGHGILPSATPENLEAFVQTVVES